MISKILGNFGIIIIYKLIYALFNQPFNHYLLEVAENDISDFYNGDMPELL